MRRGALHADEIICDSFAGGGGASLGISWALGRDVDIAINHDADAISMHRMNHPESRHYAEDVWKVDPREATAGRPVGLMWLSPDCKHFSRAKGGKPVSRRVRGLAWVAVRWAEAVRPRVIAMENVEEFLTWGPLGDDGRPCPRRQGLTFKQFTGRLRNLGYTVEWRSFRAADHGAPTTRRRLFLVARCDGLPIRWPRATHGADAPLPWRTAAECIDWTIPCPSIFDRAKPLAENTERRIAAGIKRFVLDTPRPFIVPMQHTNRPVGLDEPLQTVTTQRNKFQLVVPTISQLAHGEGSGKTKRWGIGASDYRAPLPTIHAGGNSHALVAAYLARHFTGVAGRDLRQPVPTVTAVDHHSLVTAELGDVQDRREQVRAFLIRFYSEGGQWGNLHDPMHTVTSKDRMGLVTVHGVDYAIVDIGMRMLQPRELFRAQGFPDEYEIEHGIDDRGEIVPLTKTAQVRMCGNSVCPPLAEAIVRAQFDAGADVEHDLFTQAVA